jgi:hypothetical protein
MHFLQSGYYNLGMASVPHEANENIADRSKYEQLRENSISMWPKSCSPYRRLILALSASV